MEEGRVPVRSALLQMVMLPYMERLRASVEIKEELGTSGLRRA
jgi:hypothetical protein